MLTVLGKCYWLIHWGGCNNPEGGIEGQLTKCQLADGLVFYVRENAARAHFATSSNARIAMKRGEKAGGVDVLELCCRADRWEEVADLVARLDPMGRRVRANQRFTKDWAEAELRKPPR